jgi:hypothetical protein
MQERRVMETGAWPSSQGLRVKRGAITASRRAAGPSTPVPSWNVFNNQLYDGIAAAAASLHAVAGRSTPVSARKLAASLWELQHVPVPDIFGSTGGWHSSAKESSDTTSLMSQADHLSYRSPRISTKFSNEQLSKGLQEVSIESRSIHAGRQVAAMRSHVHKLRTDTSVDANMSILVFPHSLLNQQHIQACS